MDNLAESRTADVAVHRGGAEKLRVIEHVESFDVQH